MQIILTEEEYNALIIRAGQVEALVEVRVEEEKKRLHDHILSRIKKAQCCNPREVFDEIQKALTT